MRFEVSNRMNYSTYSQPTNSFTRISSGQCQSVCSNCRSGLRSAVYIEVFNSKYFIIMNICIRSTTANKLAGRMQPTFCSWETTIEFYCAINSVNVQHFCCYFVLCRVAIQWSRTEKNEKSVSVCVCEFVCVRMKWNNANNRKTRKIGLLKRNAQKAPWIHLRFDGRNNTDNELELKKWTCIKYCVFFLLCIRLTLVICFALFSKSFLSPLFSYSFAYLNAPQHA